MMVEVLSVTEKSFKLISQAYRLCYNSAPKNYPDEQKFVKACIKNGHESPLEHASATFLISGISRTCSHQLVRHRLASYTQESQRYVDSTGAAYTIPGSIRWGKSNLLEQYQRALTLCELTYKDLVAAGVKKEDARFVLPQAIQTKIMVTMNFRELRHFFDLRLDKRAQWEIRKVAENMLETLVNAAPEVDPIFDDLARKYFPDIFIIKK